MFLFSEGGGHHTPLIVEFINHYVGEPVYHFQMAYTRPIWVAFFNKFGTTPEKVFASEYSPQTAIPWYTVMFVIACILTVVAVRLLKGRLSDDDPKPGQLTLEAGYLAIKGLVVSVIGEHGFKYFPVVATFAILILVSNLMGQFPLFMSPTASVNVTFALGISSFVYYNYVGIAENGIWGHLGHLAGPRLPILLTLVITPLIFAIELISNLIRPFTLGVRLFANMFSDEKVFLEITNLAPPITHFVLPLVLTMLGVFVAFVQAFVFTLLSTIYLSEVSHAHHDEHEDEPGVEAHGEAVVAHA
ncbi:MAG TPA: F0F1 ATP synthase subunit A [Pyrinomonadaceae bacterium]|nr:F0F1 ATP synthase subunit A [Chloracidobacterium sp.]MBP9935116.1 F0F1 ATP synthase subunit A [Pyrinomonadaceae bacterium]MBK7803457.1 F0F1 ATP synthase subunit A [Chloracidobacterium sp.]MBL0241233.1 F0F1 ATP synthase subunit A [Chloracidobacterium sp.]HQX54904.1 F0F1 ATP synthase subunit A [Pyrinomonadaceae bacterium]